MRKKATQYPDLVAAGHLLSELADAFKSGTYEGIHAYHNATGLFSRLNQEICSCGNHACKDPLLELVAVISRARHGVHLHAKFKSEAAERGKAGA